MVEHHHKVEHQPKFSPVIEAQPERKREFAVRPRGTDRLFPVRYVPPEQWNEPPRLISCPTAWTVLGGKPVFWPSPGTEYQVFELKWVECDARAAD